MRPTAITATLASAGLLVLLTACGERQEPTGLLPPDLPATVAGAGEEPFVSESVPTRVVALDDGLAAMAYELGASIVGAPSDTLDPAIDVISTPAGEIDIDVVRELSPDLILATRATDAEAVAALDADPGAPIYIGPASEVGDLVQSAYELALILGDPVLAREVAASLEDEIESASARALGREPVRVFVDTGLRIPPDPDSLFVEILERAGGVFVPEDATRGSSVEPAELAAAAPDVYLATIESRVSLASLSADEELATLPAVIGERVVIIDREILGVSGPDVIATIEELAEILHPSGS